MLRSLSDFSGKNWADQLDLAEFAINESENSATGLTPLFANYAGELEAAGVPGRPQTSLPECC